MSIPVCPLLLQARATAAKLIVGWEDFRDGEKPASVTEGALYPIPSEAPGVACIGSRCAWWDPEPGELSDDENGRPVRLPTTTGRCGQVKGRNFKDPALMVAVPVQA